MVFFCFDDIFLNAVFRIGLITIPLKHFPHPFPSQSLHFFPFLRRDIFLSALSAVFGLVGFIRPLASGDRTESDRVTGNQPVSVVLLGPVYSKVVARRSANFLKIVGSRSDIAESRSIWNINLVPETGVA